MTEGLFSRVVRGMYGHPLPQPMTVDELRGALQTAERDLATARANLRDALARRDETGARLHEERIVAVDARRRELVGLLAAAEASEQARAEAFTERAVAQQAADEQSRLDGIERKFRTYQAALLRRRAAEMRAELALQAARRSPMPASADEADDWRLILQRARRLIPEVDLASLGPDELERRAVELERE